MQKKLEISSKALIFDFSSLLILISFKAKGRFDDDRACKYAFDDIIQVVLLKLADESITHVLLITYDINWLKTSISWLDDLNSRLISLFRCNNIAVLEVDKREYLSEVLSVCNKALDLGYELILVGDELLYLSLLSKKAVIYKNGNDLVDENYVLKRYGIGSNHIIDIVSLTGAINGGVNPVSNIHEKDAVEFINRFGSVSKMLSNRCNLPAKIASKLDALSVNYDRVKCIVSGRNSDLAIDFSSFKLSLSSSDILNIVSKDSCTPAVLGTSSHHRVFLRTSSKLACKYLESENSILNRLQLENTITESLLSKYLSDAFIEKPTRIAYIYTLTDPRDPENIRYIGKTGNPDNRLKQHIRTASSNGTLKEQWVWTLVSNNISPHIRILDKISYTYDCEWSDLEQYYIKHYFDLGFNLLNDSIGGLDYSHIESNELLYDLLSNNLKNRLALWASSKNKLNEKRFWKEFMSLSQIKSNLFNGKVCKYCGVYT